MALKTNNPVQTKSVHSTEKASIPAEVLRGLPPEAVQRLQRFVDSSEHLQRLAYGEDDEPQRR